MPPNREHALWSFGAAPRREAEVGEGAVTVEVDNKFGDLAVADVKQGRTEGPRSLNIKLAGLATREEATKSEDPVKVEFPILLDLDSVLVPRCDDWTTAAAPAYGSRSWGCHPHRAGRAAAAGEAGLG
jgi:hypothetical protein